MVHDAMQFGGDEKTDKRLNEDNPDPDHDHDDSSSFGESTDFDDIDEEILDQTVQERCIHNPNSL